MDGGRVLEVVEAVLATRFKVIMTSIADLKFVKKIPSEMEVAPRYNC